MKLNHITEEPSQGVLSVYREALLDLLTKYGIDISYFKQELGKFFVTVETIQELTFATPQQLASPTGDNTIYLT